MYQKNDLSMARGTGSEVSQVFHSRFVLACLLVLAGPLAHHVQSKVGAACNENCHRWRCCKALELRKGNCNAHSQGQGQELVQGVNSC